VETLKIGGVQVEGTEVRSIFSLRSASFTITCTQEEVTFRVTGYGHGVGMSQYGANELARQGKTWQEILQWYYTGVTIDTYAP
jgi:stage II sporulation protein D